MSFFEAALGPVVYDTALDAGSSEETISISIQVDQQYFVSVSSFLFQILTVAVLGILLTAPLGATLISLTGPKLLRKDRQLGCKEESQDEVSKLNSTV